jgi:hypothetical protein
MIGDEAMTDPDTRYLDCLRTYYVGYSVFMA